MMNDNKILASVLMKIGTGLSSRGDSRKKKKTNKVVMLFIFFILIPVIFTFGFLAFYLTDLKPCEGVQENVMQLGMCIAGSTMLFFGLLMVPGIFYYSDDIEYLLPFPIREDSMINVKLLIMYISENLTAVIVFMPILIGSFIAFCSNWFLYWLIGIFVALTLSIVPMLYGVIIVVVLVRFTPFGKDKKKLSILMSCFSIFLSVFITIAIIEYMFTGEDVFVSMILPNNAFVNTIQTIFPHFKYGAKAMVEGDIIYLLPYIGYIIFIFAVYRSVIRFYYSKGLQKVLSGSGKVHTLSESDIISKSLIKYPITHLIKKEFINLFHNPTFFSSCIATNLMFPVFLYFMDNTFVYEEVRKVVNISNINGSFDFIILVSLIVVFIVPCGMNYISSTSISREGVDFMALRYLPINTSSIIISKMLSSLTITLFTFLLCIFILIFKWGLNISLGIILEAILYGIIISGFLSELGIFIDAYNPTILWTEPQKAVKENFNGVALLVFTLVFSTCLLYIGFFMRPVSLYLLSLFLLPITVFLHYIGKILLNRILEE